MPADTRRRVLVLPVAIVAVATSGLVTLTSTALFTSTDTIADNAFTRGTLTLDGVQTVGFAAAAVSPGDTVTGTLEVRNTGSLQARYAVRAAPTGQTALIRQVTAVASVGDDEVYRGPLAGFQIGNPSGGAQPGDRVLAAGTSEVVDVTLHLPRKAGNTAQGRSFTAKFIFDAEQTPAT